MNVDTSLRLALRQITTQGLLRKCPSQLRPMDILKGRLIHHKAHHHSRCNIQPRWRLNKSPQDVYSRVTKRQEKRNVAQAFFRPLHVVAVSICCCDWYASFGREYSGGYCEQLNLPNGRIGHFCILRPPFALLAKKNRDTFAPDSTNIANNLEWLYDVLLNIICPGKKSEWSYDVQIG
ncbi:hypothetical protein BO85DRAFT_442172 [Aspergillus piperis CBS 112811]|uniref:Uncharacterized protein n=1 Tax=Aspergillus piperis CBS 112811 TaxID=1448313 RepID=A0A8G1VIA3_9EURO|nr:hypothetical protein BO85DRAFT_442172 [Aspergillus piperis CBS 112811]RAH53465.1 hypothetical protein BO85DRAFT_442172 [Aspergillus piperis CBS 112811]